MTTDRLRDLRVKLLEPLPLRMVEAECTRGHRLLVPESSLGGPCQQCTDEWTAAASRRTAERYREELLSGHFWRNHQGAAQILALVQVRESGLMSDDDWKAAEEPARFHDEMVRLLRNIAARKADPDVA